MILARVDQARVISHGIRLLLNTWETAAFLTPDYNGNLYTILAPGFLPLWLQEIFYFSVFL